HNFLFSGSVNSNTPYDQTNTRKVRFGLGSAALGTGFGVFGPVDLNGITYPYHTWWYDEYAVDLTTGRSSASIANTGWLGQPLGVAYQMIWVGTTADAVSNADFEVDVTTGWNFYAGVPATVSHDATTAAAGSASARIHTNSPGPYDWSV